MKKPFLFNDQWLGVLLLVLLSACSTREGLAPVVDSRWRLTQDYALQHVVRRGETLYGIAFRYDQDYRRLAKINQLSPPYTLYVGQSIFFQPRRSFVPTHVRRVAPLVRRPYAASSVRSNRVVRADVVLGRETWRWPASGRVVTTFAPALGRKGIDIAGKKGDRIRAVSSGVVAYAGNGIEGYGNLIIIKHPQQRLTAYGNNLRNLVREGQSVAAGQVIAEMGVVDRRFWGVHFEMRQGGTPINPLNYLKKG